MLASLRLLNHLRQTASALRKPGIHIEYRNHRCIEAAGSHHETTNNAMSLDGLFPEINIHHCSHIWGDVVVSPLFNAA
jgi:hypothetical protein